MAKIQNGDTHSVDFSNYNPYYNDVSEYLKASNKARFLFTETRDLEPYSTAITILVNTTNPYLKSKFKVTNLKGKEETLRIQQAINQINEFMILKVARFSVTLKKTFGIILIIIGFYFLSQILDVLCCVLTITTGP